ncbi:MAG: hypothetical protein NTX17_02375 [Candidatus Eisenbacteria bacterium]|nr:hypothetical protein [Candidatus Eisenbacteria bacterium]
MDQTTRDRIKANLFPMAHPSVEPWDGFRWHIGQNGVCDTDREHSSQALAIDVFGTLALLDSRDRIFNALLRSFDLESSGHWTVELEWPVPNTLLGEPRETQVDAVARSERFLVFMECKFSESEPGRCSQPEPLSDGAHKGLRQCSGNYELQVNPVNDKSAWCPLTAKGIKYWEHIPGLFGISSTEVHAPCPFADSRYQWMRNIVACWAQSRIEKTQPVFLVVYADVPEGPQLPAARLVRSESWALFKRSIKPNTVVRELSYLDLIDCALALHGPDSSTLRELRGWVEAKVRKIAGST